MELEKGFCIWFTGVPAAGKSTVATAVEKRLRARGVKLENLDADEVRKNLSPDLKFSKEDRDMNTKRLAYMASLLCRNGASALIAAVASYREFRDRARRMIPHFVEVWVDCPTEECRRRDPKGLYAKGDRGEVNDIAGVHQPYEAPLNPEVHLKTDQCTVDEAADMVIRRLEELGYLPKADAEGGDEVYSAEEEEKIKERLKSLGYL